MTARAPQQGFDTDRPWRKRLARASVYGLLGLWSAICLLPLYWLVITSLKSGASIDQGPYYLPFVDFTPSLESWRFILSDAAENLDMRLVNSLLVSVAATAIDVIFALLLIYGVTRLASYRNGWLGNEGLLTAVVASRLLAPAVLVVPLYMLATVSGILDTRSLLALCYAAINLPVAVWLLRPVLGRKASAQEEAAQLDGASHLTVLTSVLLPMIRGSCGVVALIVFTLCWNEYLLAAALTFDHAETLTPWMVGQLAMKEAQTGGQTEEWAHLSAASVLMMVPLLLAAGTVQRFLSRTAPWQA